METLNKLWCVAEQEAERAGQTFKDVFGEIGLYLERPLEPASEGYENTPLNSSTFAYTGGEGVHFGLIHVNGEVCENSPVVMTVPVNSDEPHVIVGENLLEFLCLACRISYFDLEQLVYDRDDTIRWINLPDPQVHTGEVYGYDVMDSGLIEKLVREKYLSNVLSREFSLTPWSNLEQRLNELSAKYLSLLEVAPE